MHLVSILNAYKGIGVKMISLFLAMIVSGTTVEKSAIDNVTFKTVAQCQQYKKAMHYADSKSLKFTCEKTK